LAPILVTGLYTGDLLLLENQPVNPSTCRPRLHIIKKNQEFIKPREAATTVTTRLVIELLPFDSKYKPERTPAAPKNRLTKASA
jgi:hypothetical protein